MLRQATHTLAIETRAGLHEITAEVVRWVAAQGMRDGLLINRVAAFSDGSMPD